MESCFWFGGCRCHGLRGVHQKTRGVRCGFIAKYQSKAQKIEQDASVRIEASGVEVGPAVSAVKSTTTSVDLISLDPDIRYEASTSEARITMDLAHTCVKHQRRSYVCQGLAPPNTKCAHSCCHQMRSYVLSPNAFIRVSPNAFIRVSPNALVRVHQMRLYVCHQMRLPSPQRSSFRSLTFVRFARTFFNGLNLYSCLKNILVQWLILV